MGVDSMTGFDSKRDMAADKVQEDLINYGTAWSQDGKRIDPMSVYKEQPEDLSDFFYTCNHCGAEKLVQSGNHHPWCACGSDNFDWCNGRPAHPSQEPVCPDCKAKVLYECVACSSNNYPPKTEQGPVVVHQFRLMYSADWHDGHPDPKDGYGPYETRTLYTAPPQRKPLTVQEIAEFVGTHEYGSEQLKWFRFGEAAHGIKE